MDNIIESLNTLHSINAAYSLSNEQTDKLLDEAKEAKFCIPIIGKFSSGKSALINACLGYSKKLLKENILPETAVPTEITYAPVADSADILQNDGSHESISVFEYKERQFDANSVKRVRLNLKNSFLENIPDVMLVDMPGFDSGIEVHNTAIDNYISQSLAYIIAFPADDMIVRSNIGNTLKELCLNDMPICVVITKSDKQNDFDQTFSHLKSDLKRFIGDREIRYCTTSSHDAEIKEFSAFLEEIQNRSGDILEKKFRTDLAVVIESTSAYLKSTLKGTDLTESELDSKHEKLIRQLDKLNSDFFREQNEFDAKVRECIRDIKGDISVALNENDSTFVSLIMNNQDIKEKLNLVVREAVTESVGKRFVPMIKTYLKNVEECIISENIEDVSIPIYAYAEETGKNITSSVVATVAGILFGGPIIGIIVGIISALFNKINNEKKLEEKRQKITMELHTQIYPKILAEVGQSIETEIVRQTKIINSRIEGNINSQRDSLEKSVEDLRLKISDEKEKKENLILDVTRDLETIDQIKSSVCL